MTKLHSHFQYDFMIGGPCLVALLLCYPVKLRKVGISGLLTPSVVKPIQKKYNSSESSTLPGYSIGNTDIRIICLIYFLYVLSGSTRSDGRVNTKPNFVERKMLNISAEQKPRTTPSKTFTHLTILQNQHPNHPPLPK